VRTIGDLEGQAQYRNGNGSATGALTMMRSNPDLPERRIEPSFALGFPMQVQ